VMQTKTAGGMQTMEQALADLTMRRVVNVDDAISRSSRPDQLIGTLERSGFDVAGALAAIGPAKTQPHDAAPAVLAPPHEAAPALRMAGS
jgi:hypothetical protein